MFRSWRKQLGLLVMMAMTLVSVVPVAYAASAPNIITYQGRVLNANGVPVSDASLSMSFALYTAVTGGTCVWSNSSDSCASVTARTVTLTTGLFTENLGDTGNSYAAIGDSIFGDNAALYLEVIIAGETLTPRRAITAAPYALNADTLDGIDSATLQLFETGSSRTFEDDAPVIIGTNAAFTYGSGGVGDVRVADELEVMGDGYIDNDLVVGASTSSTETIANVAFTLGGDDLFVAGDVGVEGTIYTDGSVDVVGGVTIGGDLTITGDDLFMGTNTLGALLVADGTNFNPVVLSGDATISATGVLAIAADAVALSTDTTGNYVASVGTSVLTGLTGGAAGSEGAALSLALDYSQALSGDVGLSANAGVFGTSGFVFEGSTADTIETFLVVTDPTASDKTITIPNLTGTVLLSGHTLTGDVTATLGASNTTALTIAADAVALSTDTTGNYVATIADAGGSDFTIVGSGSEGAAVTLDIAADAVDWDELADAMTLDASTSIAMDGSETFTITNGSSEGIIFNLSSTGDFILQDNGTAIFTVTDAAILEFAATSGGVDLAGTRLDLDADNDTSVIASTDDQIDWELGGIAQTLIMRDPLGADDASSTVNPIFEINYATPADTTGTNMHTGLLVDMDVGNASGGTNTVAGLTFEALTGDAEVANLHAISIGALTGTGATNETAISIGDGWDAQAYFNDTTSILRLANAATLTVDDGTNNLLRISDLGSAGSILVNTHSSFDDSGLTINPGGATGVADFGETLALTGGVNTAGGSGGDGGAVTITGGAGAGDGTAVRGGGNVEISGGSSSVGTGPGGNVLIVGGDSTTGTNGNVNIQSGGSPTTIVMNGGDIGLSADDDIFFSADDDVTFDVISAGAIINLFDNDVTKTIAIGGVLDDGTDTINIATNNTTADTLAIGNTNTGTTIAITGGNDWSVTATGIPTFRIARGNSYTEAICYSTNDVEAVSLIEDCVGSAVADYAEQYPVAAGVEYGDIVVPGTEMVRTDDEQQGEQFIAKGVLSSYAYQGPVYGVVSNNYHEFTSAGYNIDAADNPMPVALVGRVPVKVVAENGPIQIGDYLATSSTPGAAMKATQIGRVIGMALENWNGEKPTIMVQVNNSWYMGDILAEDGTSVFETSNVVVSSMGTSSQSDQTFDSYGLALRGSAWNGSEAQAVEMMLKNVVDDEDSYRLSVRNTIETEVAYITQSGTMKIAGDMVIGGRLYPSDRGTPQTEKYIYYDGSAGPGGDFMRTNAKGWATGSYDFAEMFPSSEKLTSGDAVAFSGTGEAVQRATGKAGEQLAGIVSTRPGFLAGENVKGAYPIALAGRVPTKVSTANGAIVVGDPLTASTTAGVAMKATEAGQIIGYALENYTGSESDNLILAYVNVGYWSGGPQTITIVQNQASQAPSDAQSFSALNMSGSIYMATNSILSIGRLEGVSGIWSIESDGTIKTSGSLKTVTESYQGTKVETVAVTSPESVITLTGTATLNGGRAEVRFEDVVPQFNDVISAIAPIRVIVTPSGPVSLYISEKDQNHFVVERFVGSADVEFDWMVTGYRKGFEPEEEEIVEEESLDTSVLLVPSVPSDLSALPDGEEPEPAVQEEPASPESPDETLIDSPAGQFVPGPAPPDAIEDDGGQAAEPSDVVIETLSTPEP